MTTTQKPLAQRMFERPKHTIAVVFSSARTAEFEQAAAMQGIARFKAFGVGVETRMLDVDTEKVGRVRCGNVLKQLATEATSLVGYGDLDHLSLANFGHSILLNRPLVTGIAITPTLLTRIVSDGELVSDSTKVIGVGTHNGSAVVSVGALRFIEDPEIYGNAIRLAVIHELGHVFGVEQHCKATACVMQETQNKNDFVARFVVPGLDFCGECAATVTREIRRMTETRM